MYHITQPTTVVAQFGVAGGRRKQQAGNFENLQEMAKQQQQQAAAAAGAGIPDLKNLMNGGADMAELQKMIQESLQDPETQKYLQEMGTQFGAAMEQLAQMTPEQIQAQMAQALDVLQSGDMLEGLVESRDAVIAQLEATGTIPKEEIAKMKADPQYFELKMRESFDSMKDMFQNPEMLEGMAAAMASMKDLMDSGDEILDEMTKMLTSGELQDDDKIEEARLQILRGDFSENPLMKEMFASEEMQELLKDPVKWRESVKEGQANIAEAGKQVKDEL